MSVYSCKESVLCYKVRVYSYTDLRRNKATAGRVVPFKKFVTENAHPDPGSGRFLKGQFVRENAYFSLSDSVPFKSFLSGVSGRV